MDSGEFILACNNCGQRIILKNGIEYDEITQKIHFIISDIKEVIITCTQCSNRIKF